MGSHNYVCNICPKRILTLVVRWRPFTDIVCRAIWVPTFIVWLRMHVHLATIPWIMRWYPDIYPAQCVVPSKKKRRHHHDIILLCLEGLNHRTPNPWGHWHTCNNRHPFYFNSCITGIHWLLPHVHAQGKSDWLHWCHCCRLLSLSAKLTRSGVIG